MSLYLLELKRQLKSRRTIVIISLMFIFSIAFAWLSISYETIYSVGNGEKVLLKGRKAILYKQKLRKNFEGEMTPEKFSKALEGYQQAIEEYGDPNEEGFPLEVRLEKIFPSTVLNQKLSEAYADPKTGMAANLLELDSSQAVNFYSQTKQHLKDVISLEQPKYPSALRNAEKIFYRVHQPYVYFQGYSGDAIDYVGLYMFVFLLLSIALSTPVFCGEYQTGADSILRTTKSGRKKLALIKIGALFSILVVIFVLCVSAHIGILDWAFGRESKATSIQMIFSVISLPALNVGQVILVSICAGLLTLFATTMLTIFLSARLKEPLTALMSAFSLTIAPVLLISIVGSENWLTFILPSSGLGMKNSFLTQLLDLSFLHIGSFSFWTPQVIIVAAIIETILFFILGVRAYLKHQVT